MEGGAFSTAEFKAFASDVVLFAHITTRIPDHPYEGLMKAVGGKYFPTLLFMDGLGKVVGRVDIFDELTVPKFKTALANTKNRLALLDMEEPTAAERTQLFLLDAGLGMLDFDVAKERAAELGKLEGDAAKQVAQVLTDFEVEDHLSPRPRGAEAVKEVGKALLAMAKDGRTPSKSSLAVGFWSYMFAGADMEKDVEAMKWVVTEFRKVVGDDARMMRMLTGMEKKLKSAAAK